MYRIGQFFMFENEKYILAQVDSSMVALICLAEGNRWSTPAKVLDIECITYQEFGQISSDYNANTPFILVP